MLSLLRWDEREAYEKIIMGLLGAALLLAILWFILINPVLSAKSDARAQSNKALRDYNIVTRALPYIGNKDAAGSGPTFSRSVLITAARNKNIRLTRVQPDGEAINVWIDDVETGKLYRLLGQLMTQNGAELMRVSITADDNGMLSAQLTLKTGS